MGFWRRRMVGSRSPSQRWCNGCRAIINPRVTPAATRNAHCQPNINVSDGAANPASTAPKGTPVCLREKIIFRFFGFTTCINKCDAAGLVSPYPNPTNTEPMAKPVSDEVADKASPLPARVNAAWLVRAAPRRRTSWPPISDITRAPA